MAASSSSQGLRSCKYDVFISFRGTDTRNNFVSHLYKALRTKQIKAYKDDVNLSRGEEISPALLKAIEDSKISIVVLSRDYASSRWCLEELLHILKCKRERAHIVLPVFYGVDPSDVRNQKESYASAFDDHEKRFKHQMEKVFQWRSALADIGDLSGWDSRQNRPEYELVEEIAQDILSKLSNMSSKSGDEIDKKLVGMEERVKKIESLLWKNESRNSPDVRVVGIWGMGGIGKSTLARVVQNRFSSTFDSCFFIVVSDEVKSCGLEGITEKMFSTLLKDKAVDMSSSFTDDRLQRTKVFLVLDNVDDVEQLQWLIGDCEKTRSRFGEGSRIIVTSRDKKPLMESSDEIYEVEALDSDEATRLFYQNAFRRDSSNITDYRELLKRIVDYAGGNPLALKVLGSHLHSRSVKEWESALSKLRKTPHNKVQEVLKTSYDSLDRFNQSILLDVACFLKWENREFVEDILEDGSHIGINVLIEKSLLTITGGRLSMHDLIQEMAWEIIRQEPGQLVDRSRLWDSQDVISVLRKTKGSARTEGICFDFSTISKDLCLSSRFFEDMENLRLLKIYFTNFFGPNKRIYLHQGLQYLPNSLRYLQWDYYPLNSLPLDFEPQNLVILSMRGSKLEKLWSEVVDLGNLKDITLSGCRELTELPDLSQAPKLVRLDLSSCFNLRRLPQMPSSLNYLDMRHSGIEVFHSEFESLKNLEYVDLSDCKRLMSLPKFPKNVRTLDLSTYSNLDLLFGLQSVTFLDLSACNISHIPDSIELLLSVESLNLSQNDFVEIPSSLKQMNKLKYLYIFNCKNLKSVANLPTSLQVLDTRECWSLKMISVCGLTSLKNIDAEGCWSLAEFRIDERGCSSWKELLASSRHSITLDTNEDGRNFWFSFDNCSKLEQSSKDNILSLFQREVFGIETTFHVDVNVTEEFDEQFTCVWYGGNEIPKWFEHQSETSSINIRLLQQRDGMDFIGFAAAVLEHKAFFQFFTAKLCFKTRDGTIHECHNMTASLRPTLTRMSNVVMWYSYSGFSFDVEKELQDDATEALFQLYLIGGWVRKWGIHVISLNEAEDFGFSVDKQTVSLRRWITPAQRRARWKARHRRENNSIYG